MVVSTCAGLLVERKGESGNTARQSTVAERLRTVWEVGRRCVLLFMLCARPYSCE